MDRPKGRPLKIDLETIRVMIELSKTLPIMEVARRTGQRPNTAYYWVKKLNPNPIPAFVGRPIAVKEKAQPIRFGMETLNALLVQTDMQSCSLFSRDRIDRGVWLYIVNKYHTKNIMNLALSVGITAEKATECMDYAMSAAYNKIFEIEKLLLNENRN